MDKVWLITNANDSFFINLIIQLLGNGDKVVATSRYKDVLTDKISFKSDDFLPLEMDTNDSETIRKLVELSWKKFGRIDYLTTNNAYGKMGFIEDSDNQLIVDEIEGNVLRSLNVIQAVLPYFREQRCGHIFNFSSISGFVSGPGSGLHSASMFSIAAISETLSYELNPFNITVTNVMQGFFQSLNTHVKYVYKDYSYNEFRKKFLRKKNYSEFKDESRLSKGVKDFISISKMSNPPLYLFIGGNAKKLANEKIERLRNEMEMVDEYLI